jgi:hypothetical protein
MRTEAQPTLSDEPLPRSPMRLLVTGGTGVLGRALRPLADAAGHELAMPTREELDGLHSYGRGPAIGLPAKESLPCVRAHLAAVTGTADPAWSLLGLGVRTMAEGEGPYNPIEYHNGTVWPHDNSFIAAGLARYGYREEAARIAAAMILT